MSSDGSADGSEHEPTKHDEWTLLKVEWDCITRRAKARFMDQWDQREDWTQFEARYHVYKAQDQLSVASYHSRQDDADELVKTNIADAVNHMLMAMATLDVDHDECQPIQSADEILDDEQLRTDGGRDTCADEFDRDDFDLEFESLDDARDWLENRGRSISAQRIRVGDWVLQTHPFEVGTVQLAHRSYKGNIEESEGSE